MLLEEIIEKEEQRFLMVEKDKKRMEGFINPIKGLIE